MKKIISALMAVVIFLSIANMGIVVNAFTARTTAPASNNSYFYGANPYSVGQCTWYAWGRAYEILGSKPYEFSGNANKWYGQGYSCGSTPKVGSIMVTQKTSNSGHVAVVEELYSDGTMLISEYNWDVSLGFGTKKISQTATTRGAHTVLGYIYITGGSTPSTPDLIFWGISKPDNTDTGIDVSGTPTLNGSYKFWFKDTCTDSNYYINMYLDGNLIVNHGSHDANKYSSVTINTNTIAAGYHELKVELVHTNGTCVTTKAFYSQKTDASAPVISECKVAAMDD